MATSDNKLHSPFMWAFRAMDDKEYREAQRKRRDSGASERVREGRRLTRAYGISSQALLSEVKRDLENLLNTINLDSCQSLDDFPEVARSILNFGIPDLSVHVVDSFQINALAADIRNALLTFEPRMAPETLTVTRDESVDPADLKVRFVISAELRCDPVRLPSEFIADVDPGLGRIKITGAV